MSEAPRHEADPTDPLTYDELLTLLRSDILNNLESGAAQEVGLWVEPGWGDSIRLHKELCFARITSSFIARCYETERDAFRQFLRFCMHHPTADLGEEYPQGEEPDEEDDSEEVILLGLGQSFSLRYVQRYQFYLHPDDALMLAWLKFCRIPHAAKEQRNLKKQFRAFQTLSAGS